MSGSLECLSDCECFPLDGSITALCCMGEPASYESDPPAVLAAEEFALVAGAVALKHPIADAGFCPVSGYVRGSILVENFYAELNHLPLGGFKCLLVTVRP